MTGLLWLALVLPTVNAKAPARVMGKVLDCTSHSVWSEPDGWTVVRAGTEILAESADKHAVLVRTTVKTERGRKVTTTAADARAIAARVAGVELSWSKPSQVAKDKYDHTTTIDATGGDVVVRVSQRDRGFGQDIVWIEVAQGADRAKALDTMDAARASERSLVDHACVCGTDCDRRP